MAFASSDRRPCMQKLRATQSAPGPGEYNVDAVGRCSLYMITRGQLKIANKKFAALNNDYEITLNYDTQLQLTEAAAELSAAFGLAPRYVVPVAEAHFHRTTSGKIQRGA